MNFGWTDHEAMLRRRAAMSPEQMEQLRVQCEEVPSCAMCDALPEWEQVCDDRPIPPRSNAAPWILGVLGLGFGALALYLHRSSSGSLFGLDGKLEIHNRYVAKKFWGTTVLTGEAWGSMKLLSERTADAKVRQRAHDIGERLSTISREALELANEADPKWIGWKLRSTGQTADSAAEEAAA